MMAHSLRTATRSASDAVGMNLTTNIRPVDFSLARWTTPNEPLKRKINQSCEPGHIPSNLKDLKPTLPLLSGIGLQ